MLARAKLATDPLAISEHEDDISCVICMNYVHYEVDENGSLMRRDGVIEPGLEGAEAVQAPGRMASVRDMAQRMTARLRRLARRGNNSAAREQEMSNIQGNNSQHMPLNQIESPVESIVDSHDP